MERRRESGAAAGEHSRSRRAGWSSTRRDHARRRVQDPARRSGAWKRSQAGLLARRREPRAGGGREDSRRSSSCSQTASRRGVDAGTWSAICRPTRPAAAVELFDCDRLGRQPAPGAGAEPTRAGWRGAELAVRLEVYVGDDPRRPGLRPDQLLERGRRRSSSCPVCASKA